MIIRMRRLTCADGERLVVLVGDDGIPLFYPTLFVTAHLRGGSLAVNTNVNALTAIKSLYAWQEYFGIDIEARFKKNLLLEAHEIHALRDFLQKPLRGSAAQKVVSIKQPKVVCNEVQYARMSVIAIYLEFLAGKLQRATDLSGAAATAMASQIRANRPQTAGWLETDREDKHLDDEMLDSLEMILKPGSESNPVGSYPVQVRNALLFSILRTTGFRRGEALNLKIEDIDFASSVIKVIRRADSKGDVRANQPTAKTFGRPYPVLPELIQRIYEYVTAYRNKIPAARRHGYLFVVHKEGPNLGRPLSNSAFGKVFDQIKHAAAGHAGVHAHSLRHHWNYTFSKSSDERETSSAEEERTRSFLMGWMSTSGTAATYNKRRIKEKAQVATLEIQAKHLKKMHKDNEE